MTITAGAKGVHVSTNSVGLVVLGTGRASVVAAACSGGVSFNTNTFAGIDVKGAATLVVDGVPGSNGTGTVLANGNSAEGVLIEGATGSSAVTGLVAFGNTGDGIANANTNAGLCFDNDALVTAETLSAQGNLFSGVDCSATASSVGDNKNACTGGVDVGLGGSFNAVDITMCTLK